MSSLTPLTFPEILGRFALAAGLLVPLNLMLGFVFARLTNVPSGFAPFTPAPIVAGSVAGPLISTVGYLLLWAFIRDQRALHLVFVAAGIALLVASYYLPWRLTYSASPRFAGVTIAAQFALGLLHTIVVSVSFVSFLRRQRPLFDPPDTRRPTDRSRPWRGQATVSRATDTEPEKVIRPRGGPFPVNKLLQQ